MEEQEESLASFMKWAAELGVSDSPHQSFSTTTSSSCLGHTLCISSFPEAGGRGLAAVRDLRKGEMVLRVPKSALMTVESVTEKDQRLASAVKMHPSLSSTQVLAVCLLAEMNKGRRSIWYPYLMHLPRSYDTLPTFGPFETKALQVNDAIWLTEKVVSKAELDWREAIALMEQLELKRHLVTFKAWLWASATISSRTLHVPWDVAGCLCPVGDLFNYAAPGEELAAIEDPKSCLDDPLLQVRSSQNGDGLGDPNVDIEEGDASSGRLTDGGYEEDEAAYCFYAKKNYRKSEQVLLSYGMYTNLELLEHYGFLLKENPNDKVFIPLGLGTFASHSWPSDSLYIQQDGRPSFSLISALRLWKTPPNQRKSVGHLAFSGSQLSPENEIAVMKWIISSCHAILESLPSTVEDDQLLLCAIDKVEQLQSFKMPNNLPSAAAKEFGEFSELMGLCNGESDVVMPLSTQVKRCMDRCSLAIQWRLRYKKTLVDCISFCSRTIETISSENGWNRSIVGHKCF